MEPLILFVPKKCIRYVTARHARKQYSPTSCCDPSQLRNESSEQNPNRAGGGPSLPPFIAFLWPWSARRTTHLGRERDLQHHRRRVAPFLPPTTRCCSRRGRRSFSSVRRNCGSDPQIYSEFDTRALISRASPFTPSVAG